MPPKLAKACTADPSVPVMTSSPCIHSGLAVHDKAKLQDLVLCEAVHLGRGALALAELSASPLPAARRPLPLWKTTLLPAPIEFKNDYYDLQTRVPHAWKSCLAEAGLKLWSFSLLCQ